MRDVCRAADSQRRLAIDPIPEYARCASVDRVRVSAVALGLSVRAVALGGLPRIAVVILLLAYGSRHAAVIVAAILQIAAPIRLH